MAVVEPQSTPLPVSEDRTLPGIEPAAPAPKRGRRTASVLRDADGGESHAPAFLQNRAPEPAPAPAAEETERKPRRRRAPRSFEGGEGASPAAKTEEV